ncbi:MAG: type ISP restriction/modification enzyme, partial [Planctomycetota bacterium]
PSLWAAHGKRQVYLTSLLNHPLGGGPALTPAAEIPDLHHFRGSYGAKEVMPLYRDATGKEPNILPGLLELLGEAYGREVSPEDFLAYVYGVLAQPAFTERFADELGTRELRVPLTKDAGLFVEVRDVGAKLLWLHTYGERYVPEGKSAGQVPRGEARCTVAVPGDEEGYPESFEYDPDTRTLHVGEGAFAPVAPEVYAFEVSGLKVVQSWLGYRMKNPKGKKSSPLDEINPTEWPSQFNTELLELLWVLEATLAEYPRQAELLEQVVEGECFKADQLPDVPEYMRKAPKRKKDKDLFD